MVPPDTASCITTHFLSIYEGRHGRACSRNSALFGPEIVADLHPTVLGENTRRPCHKDLAAGGVYKHCMRQQSL